MTLSDKAAALATAGVIMATEAIARRIVRSRSKAWLISYAALGAAGLASGSRRVGSDSARLTPGLALAAAGYDIGRRLLGDAPDQPPPEPLTVEAPALGVVALAEELTWGALVEPALGPVATSVLFALKHPLIDGRWRRVLGLGLFWYGLAMVRRRSSRAAMAAHVVLNVAGVVKGHLTGRDQF